MHLKIKANLEPFFNLGNAYSLLAEVEEKVKNCKRAIAAFEEAVKIKTPVISPLDYAKIKNNIGNVYKKLAEVDTSKKNCQWAFNAYQAALQVFTSEKFPQLHQLVKQNLRRLLDFCEDVISSLSGVWRHNCPN